MNPINNSMDSLLSKILASGGTSDFYSFSNADGKQWIMPIDKLRLAMNLYQPSSIKGIFLKRWLPLLHHFHLVRKVLHIKESHYKLNPKIFHLLCELFDVSFFDFAIFGGTPSARQKITIQISIRNNILGYCKLSNHPEVEKLFIKEKKHLDFLSRRGVQNIPRILYCDQIDNMCLLVQTTRKTCHSKVLHKWSNLHQLYLDEITQKTLVHLDFLQTDFYKEIAYLKTIAGNYPNKDQSLILEAISFINEYYKGQTSYCCFHADFTPWNMFVEKNQLFVFDFEYAKYSFPPYMDRLHFILQILILEKKYSTNEMIEYLDKITERLEEQNIVFPVTLIAYLIHMLSLYSKLNNGCMDINDNGYVTWMNLIRHYLK